MTRPAALLLFLLSAQALAKTDPAAEAAQVLSEFFAGKLGMNQAINRIQFVGAEAHVSNELTYQLKRTAEPRRREQLLEFLAAVGVANDDVERAFLAALKATGIGEVMAGARGLGRLKSRAGVKPLIGLLEHQALGVRREAARALGAIGQAAAGGPLLKAAKLEGDLDVRLLMIGAAGRTGDKKQAAALEALLQDSSESTRLAATQALCSLGAPKCAQLAGKLLGSQDRNERLQGVMLFEGASAKQAGSALLPMLKDPDHKVRARAARLLAQGGDAKQLDWLVIESAKAQGEQRLPYEDELEKLRLTDEQRSAILKKAGIK